MSILGTVARLGEVPVLRTFRERRYERFFAAATGAHVFRGASFAAARRAAPAGRPIGYDNPAPARAYDAMLGQVYPRDYPVLFWLQNALLDGVRSVFDLGGHVGVKYYAYRRLLAFPDDLRWIVCDVNAVVEEGRLLAQTRPDSAGLAFTSEFERVSDCDALFAIGSIQYVEEDLAARLLTVTRMPTWLLLNSVPAYDGPSVVTLQNIGTAFCPYRLFNRAELLQSLRAVGYELLDEWTNPEVTCTIPFHRVQPVEAYRGFLLKRRATRKAPSA